MYQTIEAIYRDGLIFPLKEEIPVKHAKILITILSEDEKQSYISGNTLKKIPGNTKKLS